MILSVTVPRLALGYWCGFLCGLWCASVAWLLDVGAKNGTGARRDLLHAAQPMAFRITMLYGE